MVAGGTGLAPIQSMLMDLAHRGDPRPVHFYWGVRSARDLYRHDLIAELASAHSGLTYTPVLSEALPGDHWQGRTGLVHRAVMADFEDLSGFDVYLSGPPPMVEAARDDLTSLGLRDDRLFFDAFEFSPRVQTAMESRDSAAG